MKPSHLDNCFVNFDKVYMPIIQKKVKGKSIKCEICKKIIKGEFSIGWQKPKESLHWQKFCKGKKIDPELAKFFLTGLRYLKFYHKSCSKNKFLKEIFKK